MKSKFRSLIKPTNSWFMSLDYNGAEIRTFLGLSGHDQPEEDIHRWNMTHLYGGSPIDREEAKVRFFSSFYNPEDNSLNESVYSRKLVLDKHFDGESVNTIFGRTIKVDRRRAFNYVIQSTTADLTIDRAIALDNMLRGCKSKVSFIIHDEIVLDIHAEDRYKIPELKEVFQNTKLGNFRANVKAGKSYGEMKEDKTMISLIGIGEAGCNVVSLFKDHKEYNCFLFSAEQENTKYTRKLARVSKAEDCEGEAPKLSSYKTKEAIQDRVQVFVCGSSFSANYTLAILQQIKDKADRHFLHQTRCRSTDRRSETTRESNLWHLTGVCPFRIV